MFTHKANRIMYTSFLFLSSLKVKLRAIANGPVCSSIFFNSYK